ncbi:hypothetical protein N7456_012380 [Penicillium angulare]|uniref:Uncharacterized protein n=1 Tax=Penicillium angulare TaxID=116970 RepID=A0A9W9EVN9_9EURO|nr:hypothetical protein N7456_012380 [Penicillium angulare]
MAPSDPSKRRRTSETFDQSEGKRLKSPVESIQPEPKESNPVEKLVEEAQAAFSLYPNRLTQRGIVYDPGVHYCIWRLARATIYKPRHWATPQEKFNKDIEALHHCRTRFTGRSFYVLEDHGLLNEFNTGEKYRIMNEIFDLWLDFRWPRDRRFCKYSLDRYTEIDFDAIDWEGMNTKKDEVILDSCTNEDNTFDQMEMDD